MRNSVYSTCLLLIFLSPFCNAESEITPRYDARLTELPYPFSVNNFVIKSQGQTLEMSYMYLTGDADKPLVTLLHGKNFNGAYWQSTAKFLNDLGYTILIPDQIGFGKSSKPAHYQYSFAALASHTQSLIASLKWESSIILGHSMGGMLATRFALMYPDTTRKLILLNPIGLENYLDKVEYKDVDFFYKMELNKTADGIKKYQQKNYYDGEWNDTYAALTDFMIGQINHPDWPKVAWNNALTYDLLFSQPIVDELPKLTMPVKLIIGTRDRTGPGRNWKKAGVETELGRYDKLGFRTAEKIKNSTYYPLDGVGHLPHIEDFERFSKSLKSALIH